MNSIKTLETKEIYSNKWMRLREDKVMREDGGEGIYSVIEKPDFVVIVPIDSKGNIYVVEQFRYPILERTIELPQGSWEESPDSDPLEVAKGELKEETGMSAGSMSYVGYKTLACGYSNQGYHIYLATDLTSGTNNLDTEEVGLTSRSISAEEFEQLIVEGKVKDATTTTAYLLCKLKKLI